MDTETVTARVGKTEAHSPRGNPKIQEGKIRRESMISCSQTRSDDSQARTLHCPRHFTRTLHGQVWPRLLGLHCPCHITYTPSGSALHGQFGLGILHLTKVDSPTHIALSRPADSCSSLLRTLAACSSVSQHACTALILDFNFTRALCYSILDSYARLATSLTAHAGPMGPGRGSGRGLGATRPQMWSSD
jgi:hypothetical protein